MVQPDPFYLFAHGEFYAALVIVGGVLLIPWWIVAELRAWRERRWWRKHFPDSPW